MAVNRTPPFKHYPAWSTAKFFGFLRSGLREKFNRYPVKYELLKSEAVDELTGEVYKTGKKAGQPKTLKKYKCSHCKEMFRATEVQVDHIIPAGSLQSFDDLQGFAERLFCGPENLQLVCKPCHITKTKEDRLSDT